jgi:phosphate transport system permease protein
MTSLRASPKVTQAMAKGLIWAATLATVGMLLFIIAYTLVRGMPHLTWTLLTAEPADMGRSGGILPTIVGTVMLAMGGVVIAAPFGVGTAIYLVEYTREGWLTRAIRFGVDALAGIPSIVYGLFGFVFFVLTLGLGWSIVSGALTLAIMILPTIVRTAEEALRAVPNSYREVSLSLGAHKWEMIATVALPAALPGIVTGIILGIGRCVGETAAVILTAGSSLRMPTSLFSPVRTMSVHFFILAREGISDEMAWATGAVLVVSTLLVNVVINWLVARLIRRRVAR